MIKSKREHCVNRRSKTLLKLIDIRENVFKLFNRVMTDNFKFRASFYFRGSRKPSSKFSKRPVSDGNLSWTINRNRTIREGYVFFFLIIYVLSLYIRDPWLTPETSPSILGTTVRPKPIIFARGTYQFFYKEQQKRRDIILTRTSSLAPVTMPWL